MKKIKLSYQVPEDCQASADLLAPDGGIIRNLFNFRTLKGNQPYGEILDDLHDLPTGTNYRLRLTRNRIKTTWLGVFGNTGTKETGPTVLNSLQQAQDFAAGEKFYYYSTGYNEQKTSCFKMLKTNTGEAFKIFDKGGLNGLHVVTKNGLVYWAGVDTYKQKSYAMEFVERWVDKMQPLKTALVDFPEDMEAKIRAHGSYAFVAAGDLFGGYKKPTYNKAGFTNWVSTYCIKDTWCQRLAAIWATNESDDKEVNFLFGKPYTPYAGRTFASLIINEGDYSDITGLAVSDNFIFLSFGGRVWGLNSADLIRVYTLEGKLVNEFKCDTPRKLIVVENHLYYCSRKSILRAEIDSAGNITPDGKGFSMEDEWAMMDVEYNKLTDTILTASSDGLIRYYDRDLNVKDNKGNPVPYWDNPRVYNDKFYWEDWRLQCECFICIDDGLMFIGDGGNNRIQVFNLAFEYQKTISWLSTSYHVSAVDNRAFNEYLEFILDITDTKKLKWELVNNWGYHAQGEWDNQYYKLDMPFVMGGKTYATMQSLGGSQKKALVQLDPDYGIRYLNEITTPSKERTQIYPDGCIYYDQSGANIKVSKQQLLEILPDGKFKWAAPVVRVNSEAKKPENAQNNMSKRIFETGKNEAGEDIMFVYNANKTETGPHLTSLNINTGKFLANGFPSTHTGYSGDYKNDAFDIGNGVVYPGGQYIAMEGLIFCNYHGEFWAAGQVNKWHIFDSNLVALHTYGTDIKTIRKQGLPQPAPMTAGNSFSGNVIRMGPYLLLVHNDEGQHGGGHGVLIENWDSVQRAEFPATVYNAIENPYIIWPLALLPKWGPLVNGQAGWTMYPEGGYNIAANNRYAVDAGEKYLSLTIPSDIHIYFRTLQARCIVSYPLNPVTAARYEMHGWTNYEGNYHSRDGGKTMANKVQILDEAGQVIFEMWPAIDYAKRIVTLHMNQSIIFTLPEGEAGKILNYFRAFYVWVRNGVLTAKFHNYPIVNLGRVTTKAAIFRVLMYNTTATTFDQHLSLANLRFTTR